MSNWPLFILAPDILLLITLLSVFPLFIFLFWRFFRRGSRGDVPAYDEVLEAVAKLDETSNREIDLLISKFGSRVSRDDFSRLCMLISMSIEQPLTVLSKPFLLSEFLDSLNVVELVIVLEQLLKIEIPDVDAERLRTFREIVEYANSRVSV